MLRGSGYQDTGPNPYDLPAGKEYHIFIACSGNDSQKAKWMLRELEHRYPFRCVYHERDFQAGERIVDNIKEFMDKSVKVLLLISNGFLQSYHCKLEETFAISLSNESGKNCIIPVLLEDVELPLVLQQTTYIDARIQGDVIAQTREAYCRTANQVGMSPNLCNIGGDDNGKQIAIIEGSRISSCFCSCRWKIENFDIAYLNADATTRNHINEMLVDVIGRLNKSVGMRCYGIFTPLQSFLGMIVTCLVYTAIVFISSGFIYRSIKGEQADFMEDKTYVPLIVGWSLLPTVYFFVMGCIRSRMSTKLERIAWEETKRHYKKSKCLVIYNNVPIGCTTMCCFPFKLQVVVVYYDTKPCKEYLLLFLRNKFAQFVETNEEAFETWADKLIENTIAYYLHDIINWHDLPRTYYNRHETWKQKECICQLVEPYLGELSLGQNIWFRNLSKREHKTFSNGYVEYSRTIIL